MQNIPPRVNEKILPQQQETQQTMLSCDEIKSTGHSHPGPALPFEKKALGFSLRFIVGSVINTGFLIIESS